MSNNNLASSSINKVEDLIRLIENEKVPNEQIDPNRSFKFFCHCLIKSVIEIYLKFQKFEGINLYEAVQSGIDLVYHIFWILISYTNNLRLSIFLLERAILLNIEFISMSRSSSIDHDAIYIPNINDAVLFAYKKTLGPIKGLIRNNPRLEKVKSASMDLKHILSKIFFVVIDQINRGDDEYETEEYDYKKEIESKLEEIINFIYPPLLNFYNLEPPFEIQRDFLITINQFIDDHLESSKDGLVSSLIMIRYSLEVINLQYRMTKKWNSILKKIYTGIENNYLEYLEIINGQNINYHSKNKKIIIYFKSFL